MDAIRCCRIHVNVDCDLTPVLTAFPMRFFFFSLARPVFSGGRAEEPIKNGRRSLRQYQKSLLAWPVRTLGSNSTGPVRFALAWPLTLHAAYAKKTSAEKHA